MAYILKFPLQFNSDGKTETASEPGAQFDLFFKIRPRTRLIDLSYGIDATPLLQRSVASMQDVMSIALLTIRDKFVRYLRNITLKSMTASFDREQRTINFEINVQQGTTVVTIPKSIQTLQ